MAHKVFICHSSQNKQVADAACAALEAQRIACWIAPRDILAGEEYGKAIMDALSGCQIVLLIFSREANDSPQVRREIERAVSKGKIILPFRIEQVQPSDAMEYALGNTHWLDAMTPPLEKSLANLCTTISKLIERRQDSDPLWRPPQEEIAATSEPAVKSSDPIPAAPSLRPQVVTKSEHIAEPEPDPKSPRRGRGLIAGALAALLLAAAGIFAFMHHSGSSAGESATVTESAQTSSPAPPQPAPQNNTPSEQPAVEPAATPAAPPAATPTTGPVAKPSAKPGTESPARPEAAPAVKPATAAVVPPVPAHGPDDSGNAPPSNLNPAQTARMAKQLYDQRHFAKSVPLAKQSCAQNNAESCYLLGNMYVGGYGAPADPKAGAELLEKACQAAVPGACGALGVLYAAGNGVPQDHRKAITLLNTSCEGGNALDCFTLGRIFSEALYGFNRQPPKAQMYFHKACDGKVEQACNRIRTDITPMEPAEKHPRNPAN